MSNIVNVQFEHGSTQAYIYEGVWQWDRGQILRIEGLDLPRLVEVHFSKHDKTGDSVTSIGITENGVTDAPIPKPMLEEPGKIYAFVYVTEDNSAATECKITIKLTERPKPQIYDAGDTEPFEPIVERIELLLSRTEEAEENARNHAIDSQTAALESEQNMTQAGEYKNAAERAAVEAEKSEYAVQQTEESIRSMEENVTNLAAEANTNALAVEDDRKEVERLAEQVSADAAQTAEDVKKVGELKASVEQTANNAEKAAQEIIEDREQISDNKEAIEGKADAIIGTAQGEKIVLKDSSRRPFEGIRLFGRSTQDGVPSPENPVPIDSVGDKGNIKIQVTGKNLLDTKGETTVSNGNFNVKEGSIECTLKDTWGGSYIMFSKEYPAGEYTFSADSIKENRIQPLSVLLSGKPSSHNADTLALNDYYKNYLLKYGANRLNRSITFKMDAPFTIGITFGGANDEVGQIITIKNIMLETADLAGQYEPYKTPQEIICQTPNGLPGIRVSSGGNYTDEKGQRWVCDEIDFAHGKYVQRVGHYLFDGSDDEDWHIRMDAVETEQKCAQIDVNRSINLYDMNIAVNMFVPKTWGNGVDTFCFINAHETFSLRDGKSPQLYEDIEAFKGWLYENNIELLYILETQIERDLTSEEIERYKALHTNYPATVITNDAEAHMEISYVADTKAYIDNKFQEIAEQIVTTQKNLLEV